MPPIPPNSMHTHSQLLCSLPSALQRDVQVWRGPEDEVAWEGLSPNRSICFLVCPPGWLLAPAQLLHSLKPDAKHTQTDTTGLHTSNATMLTGMSIFAKHFVIYRGKCFPDSDKQDTNDLFFVPFYSTFENSFSFTKFTQNIRKDSRPMYYIFITIF